MKIGERAFQGIYSFARKTSVVLISLSLILPWASNWQMGGHWFLFGYSIPIFGSRFFQGLHAIWIFPLLFMILGFFCALLSLTTNGLRRGSLNISGAIFVLMAIHYFLRIYQPQALPPSPLTFNAPPSIGIFLSAFWSFVSFVGGMNDLIILWYRGSD